MLLRFQDRVPTSDVQLNQPAPELHPEPGRLQPGAADGHPTDPQPQGQLVGLAADAVQGKELRQPSKPGPVLQLTKRLVMLKCLKRRHEKSPKEKSPKLKNRA